MGIDNRLLFGVYTNKLSGDKQSSALGSLGETIPSRSQNHGLELKLDSLHSHLSKFHKKQLQRFLEIERTLETIHLEIQHLSRERVKK